MSTIRDESSEVSICTPPSISLVFTEPESDKRPELPISVFGQSFNALLDTGASISALSEQTYASIKRNAPLGQELSTLPVTGVTISTALQGRSHKITTQVLLPFSVVGNPTNDIFLVVPLLATSIILGGDYLTRYNVKLDYALKETYFPTWNFSVPFHQDPERCLEQTVGAITALVLPVNCTRSMKIIALRALK